MFVCVVFIMTVVWIGNLTNRLVPNQHAWQLSPAISACQTQPDTTVRYHRTRNRPLMGTFRLHVVESRTGAAHLLNIQYRSPKVVHTFRFSTLSDLFTQTKVQWLPQRWRHNSTPRTSRQIWLRWARQHILGLHTPCRLLQLQLLSLLLSHTFQNLSAVSNSPKYLLLLHQKAPFSLPGTCSMRDIAR